MVEPLNIFKLLKKPDIDGNTEIPWIVPAVIPAGYVTTIIGEPKSGKTWLALRLACELTKGGEILGGMTEVEPCNILYLMGDTGETMVKNRLSKTGWAFDKTRFEFAFLEDIHRKGRDLDLGTEDGITLLRGFVNATLPKVVFIDTLTSFHSVDENSNTDIKPIVIKLKSLAAEKNIAIILIHHTRKKKRSETGMPMTQHDSVGAGVLNRLAANMIGVDLKKDTDGSKLYLVESLASWFESFPPFSYKLIDSFDDDGNEILEMPIELNSPTEKNATETIRRYIKTVGTGKYFTRQDIARETGISVKTVGKVLNKLVKSGEVCTHGKTKGKVFFVPESQRDFLF